MMAAVAQNLHDEPQPDSAEVEMSAADFRIVESAHAICDHPAAVECQMGFSGVPFFAPARKLEQRDCLIAHARKIMSAQIRAGELLREMKERGPCLVELVDDETDEVVTDWAQVAADAWTGASWMTAAEDYHRARRGVRQ